MPDGLVPGSQFFYGSKPIFFWRSYRTAPALPEFVSEGGDLPLFGLMSDSAGAMLGPDLLVLLLCGEVGLIRVLQELSGAFMSGQVIFFSVVLGAAAVGMDSKVPVLERYLL